MVIHPATDSPDVAGAIKFAKREYRILATGPRPASYTVAYPGKRDLLICKFEIGISPQHDVVRILNRRRVYTHDAEGGAVAGGTAGASTLSPQKITIVTDVWDDPTVLDTPFYATYDHKSHETEEATGLTGTLYATGGTSGNPVILASSNLAVAVVENNYRIRVVGPGSVYFTLSQAGNANFSAAPTLASGTHIFPGRKTYSADGGAVCGGAADVQTLTIQQPDGGLVLGGGATFSRVSNPVPAPTAQPLTISIPFANRVGYQIALAATPARPGSTIVFDIVAVGANCSVTDAGVFSALGTWYGQTSFDYVAIETFNGLSVTSAPARVNVTVEVPLTAPTVNSFTTTIAYEDRGSFFIPFQGTATRGGSLVYNVVAYGLHITVTGGAGSYTVAFEANWNGSTYVEYTVTETANGVSLTSAVGRIDLTVSPPVCPQAEFSTLIVGVGAWNAGNPIYTGQMARLTSTTPAMADGTALTYAWSVVHQPGSSYPVHPTLNETNYTFDEVGEYAIKLTVTNIYGASTERVRSYTIQAAIPKPTAQSFILNIPYASRNSTLIRLRGTAVRGGTLAYDITFNAPNSNAVMSTTVQALYQAVPSSGWYGTTYFTYRVTETFNDVTATATATVTVNVQAPLALALTAVAGGFNISGGAAPYNVSLVGSYTLSGWVPTFPQTKNTEGLVSVPTAGWCASGAYFRVVDAFGSAATIYASQLGVPTCAPPIPWGTLRFTYIGGGVFRYTNDGKNSIGVSFVNASISYSNQGMVSPNVFQITILGNCYQPGGGVRITDQSGGNVFHAFDSGDGIGMCPGSAPGADVTPTGWTRIYNESCEVGEQDIYHATNTPPGVYLDDVDFGWGVYTYYSGGKPFIIKMGVAPFLDGVIAGTPNSDSWHSFTAAAQALQFHGVADPASTFDIYAWENIFGSLATDNDRWGKLHVIYIDKKL